MADNIIYRTQKSICLYNVNEKASYNLLDLNKNDKYFSIGKITTYGDSLKFILYNSVDYTGFSLKKEIHEREYLYKEGKCILLSNNIITDNDNKLYIESIYPDGSKKVLEIDNLKDRYFMKNFNLNSNTIFSSEDGNIVMNKDGKPEYLFKSSKSKGNICGYYSPDISPDGKYLVCSYECSGYSGKKIVGDINLVEMNMLDRTVKCLGLIGTNPKYSNSGNYILFRSKNGFSIINKNEDNSILHLSDVIEAYWIGGITKK
jgi:hypothetical protein